MVYYFAISWPAYGGEDGLSIYIRNEFPGLNTLNPLSFFAIAYVLLILAIAFSFLLSRSRFGLALGGARQNVQRLATVGISPFRVRLTAFVLSGMMTGLAAPSTPTSTASSAPRCSRGTPQARSWCSCCSVARGGCSAPP